MRQRDGGSPHGIGSVFRSCEAAAHTACGERRAGAVTSPGMAGEGHTATPESLLIVRLKLKSLLQEEEWEEAAAVGMSGLRAAAVAPPSDTNNEETTQIATALADLGLLVDADVVSRFLCGAHSCGQLAQPLLREATVALKRLKGHDVEAWSRGILNGGAAKLETMDAALDLLDTATSHVVVSHPTFQSTIQRELCSPDEARRAGALQVIGTAVLTTPALAVPLLPVLVRAVFVETTPLKQAALANVLDAAFALARLPPPAAEGSDEQQLFGSLMQWLPQMLSAPLKGLQTLAALGLAKLVLHRKEASLLCACTDPEHLIAQLGRRYTACDQPSTDLAASTHVPDPMPILLAFFEELKARRQDDLGNTVASGLRLAQSLAHPAPQLSGHGLLTPPRAARVLSCRCTSSLPHSHRANRRSRGWCSMRWRASGDSTRSMRRHTDVQSFSLRLSTPTTPTSSPPPSA